MEARQANETGQGRSLLGSDATALALLLLLAAALHAWMLTHTTVTARDSIGYVRYALMLERHPWLEVLPKIEQHPLYPVALLGMSVPVRAVLGATAEAMTLSGQLVNALGGVFLVVPMFFLGKELFERRVGFWAAVLFQCLPIGLQVTSDALSDGLFLLLLTTALLFAVRALNRQAIGQLFLCGLVSGLAYLTRPEGVLVPVAAMLVLMVAQFRVAWHWPWRRAAVGVAALGVGSLICAGPYMAVIKGITVKPSALRMLTEHAHLDATRTPGLTRGPLLATWWPDQHIDGPPTLSWGLKSILLETMHSFHYAAWLPALIGLWWFRREVGAKPGTWVILALLGMLLLLLGRLVLALGYLSERHTLMIVLCGSVWATATLVRSATVTAAWLQQRGWWRTRPVLYRTCTITWLLVWTMWCLPETLKPLHANRTGFRKAGAWLAQHVEPGDEILDPLCWSHFYSGKIFDEGQPAPAAPGHQPLRYVVLTESKNAHNNFTMTLGPAQKMVEGHEPVYCWQPSTAQYRQYKAEEVRVYALPIPAKK